MSASGAVPLGPRLAWCDHPGGHRLLAVVAPATVTGAWHVTVLSLDPRRRGRDAGGSCASTRWPVGAHQVEDQLRALGWPGLPAEWSPAAIAANDLPWPPELHGAPIATAPRPGPPVESPPPPDEAPSPVVEAGPGPLFTLAARQGVA